MSNPHLEQARFDVELDRDLFHRHLIGELAETLQETVGEEHAEGYITLVGARMGRLLDDMYRRGAGATRLSREQVSQALVDLKRRIGGTFRLVDEDSDATRLTYHNTTCPFGDRVEGRPSLCMMTSNVFGSIAARNLGYARVELEKTIANGDGHCRVTVHLEQQTDALGKEHFGPLPAN